MPTVIREAGFEVRIYTLDHPPPRVHVERAGAERLVAKHSQLLKEAWRQLHGGN